MELGWARKTRGKVEEDEGGSAQTERGSGDDCDDEDGCESSGEENGESRTQTHPHTHTHTHIQACRLARMQKECSKH